MKRNNYKEFKNYVHNELKISKEEIQSIIKETVNDEINKLIGSQYFEHLIEKTVRNLIKEQFNFSNTFRDNVRGIVANEVGKQIASHMKINVEFSENNNEKVNLIYTIDNK